MPRKQTGPTQPPQNRGKKGKGCNGIQGEAKPATKSNRMVSGKTLKKPQTLAALSELGKGRPLAKPDSEVLAKKADLTLRQQALTELVKRRLNTAKEIRLQVSLGEDGQPEVIDKDSTGLSAAKLLFATGTDSVSEALHMACAVLNAQPGRGERDYNATLGYLAGLAPDNTLEGLLTGQMVAVHNMAMAFMGRAASDKATPEGINQNINRASRLMSLFIRQTETLHKLRNPSQQIQVKHQHVHVDSGAQAVIGDIHQGRG